jgi:hypothetical protein
MKKNNDESYIIKKINNTLSKQNNSITKCTKTGLIIKEYGNEYKNDPFHGINPLKLKEDEDKIKQYKASKILNTYEFLKNNNSKDGTFREIKEDSIRRNEITPENEKLSQSSKNLITSKQDYLSKNITHSNITIKNEKHINENQSQTHLTLDLNIDNYSREDLFKLFGLQSNIILNEDILKEVKKILYKIHPDKSKLDEKYFIFFSQAYQKINDIFLFQNTFQRKENKNSILLEHEKYYNEDNSKTLNTLFENNINLKKPENFNTWFNSQFEKYNTDNNINENGYGNWLSSNEDIIYTPKNLNGNQIKNEINKVKKNIQSLTHYKGFDNNNFNATNNCYSLMEYNNNNYTSNMLFNNGGVGYTDLKQAYNESVIPVCEDDFDKIPKYKNIEEFKYHRDNTDITPMNKEESHKLLYFQNKKENEESSALAFYYAQQEEKNKKNNDLFWSSLKQISNGDN